MGTPVRMMMTPIPQTTGSEMKLKTSRKAQNTKYVTGMRRFTWGRANGNAPGAPALLPTHPGALGMLSSFLGSGGPKRALWVAAQYAGCQFTG